MSHPLDSVLKRGAVRTKHMTCLHLLSQEELNKLNHLFELGYTPTELMLLGMDRFGSESSVFNPVTGEWRDRNMEKP